MLFEKYNNVDWESFCKMMTIDNKDFRELLKKKKFEVVPILMITVNGKIEQVYNGLDAVANWMEQVKHLNAKNNQTSIDSMSPTSNTPQAPPSNQTSIMDQQHFEQPPPTQEEMHPSVHPSQVRDGFGHIKKGMGHEEMKGGSSLISSEPPPSIGATTDIGGMENFDQKMMPSTSLTSLSQTTSLMADVTQEAPDISSLKNKTQDGKKTDIKSAVAAMAAERESDIQMIENMDDFMKKQKQK